MVGDFVVYECLPGFALLENMFVVCQPDAIWSALPYCARKFSIHSPLNSEHFGYSMCHFSTALEPLYRQSTRPPTFRTLPTVLPTTGTTGKVPPPRYCLPIPDISNAYPVDYTGTRGVDRPEVGDRIVFACSTGYKFADEIQSIVCLDENSWSTYPRCGIYFIPHLFIFTHIKQNLFLFKFMPMSAPHLQEHHIRAVSKLTLNRIRLLLNAYRTFDKFCFSSKFHLTIFLQRGYVLNIESGVSYCDTLTNEWYPELRCLSKSKLLT